jgi:hypothetical protein
MILTASAIVLAAAGGIALFAPDELARALEATSSRTLSLTVQLIGSGFLSLAVLNWMSRGNRIGGIYARPTGIANLLMFMTAAFSVGKAANAGALPAWGWAGCVITGAFALAYAWLVFAHDPLGPSDGTKP